MFSSFVETIKNLESLKDYCRQLKEKVEVMEPVLIFSVVNSSTFTITLTTLEISKLKEELQCLVC